MLEPWELEDTRQAEWDRKCAAAPRCAHCNASIYPHDTYLKIEDLIFCEPCVAYGTRSTDTLEV